MINEPGKSAELHEVVLSVSGPAAKAHRELYALNEDSYIMSSADIVSSIVSLGERGPDRFHIAADWIGLLKIALWNSNTPLIFDVLSLLKKAGASDSELQPFKKSDINDLLPWLYYGKKFDILRKLCQAAKAKAETKLNRKGLHIYCHLVSDDSQRIIASSL